MTRLAALDGTRFDRLRSVKQVALDAFARYRGDTACRRSECAKRRHRLARWRPRTSGPSPTIVITRPPAVTSAPSFSFTPA